VVRYRDTRYFGKRSEVLRRKSPKFFCQRAAEGKLHKLASPYLLSDITRVPMVYSRRQGARIELESELGHGSLFRIVIPTEEQTNS
jgi:hypothetical protein